MPTKADIKLDIFIKEYNLADNRSVTVWNIKSQEDPNFYFQLRFEPTKNKINFDEVKNNLLASIKKLQYANTIFFNGKLEFLKYFINLGFDTESTAIIQKNNGKSSKALFKCDKHKQNIIKAFDKELNDLFVVDIIKKNNKTYYLSYEIPEDITGNTTPLCSISIFSGKKLSEKIYLFPGESLKDVINTLKNSNPINLANLSIPYVKNTGPYSEDKLHNNDIQIRINLQTIISEILTHLGKPSFLRKNGSEKVNIFSNLAKSIANGEALSNISSQFNAHDTWKILAQHRDPWGFFAFFKGKTHSLIAWEALKEEISSFTANNQSLSALPPRHTLA